MVNHLTVAENIFLGVEQQNKGVMDWDKTHQEAQKLLDMVQLDVSAEARLGDLGTGQQQLVEIARALGKNAKILVLDEPSSSLTEQETTILLNIVKSLKNKGISCIYISHKLDEVMEISDRVMVIRDGQHVGTEDAEGLSKDKIITMMVGRELTNLFPKEEHDIGDTILSANNFTVTDATGEHVFVDDVSFELKKGEILGFSGLVGAGRSELMLAIFGSWNGRFKGNVNLNGKQIKIKSAKDALKNNIALVPEDRKNQGIVGIHSVADNIILANLPKYKSAIGLDVAKSYGDINSSVQRLKIKTASPEIEVKSLSGGNQQKVVLAKLLLTKPDILILDEPTRGIDVGAKYEIYKLMFELVKNGVSIIMVSSEMPEILGICDRVVVMHEGEFKGDFINDASLTQEKILHAAIGE